MSHNCRWGGFAHAAQPGTTPAPWPDRPLKNSDEPFEERRGVIPMDAAVVASQGAVVAAVARWVFGVDVQMHWVLGIGVGSRLFGGWLLEHTGPSVSLQAWTGLALSALVVLPLLGVVQLVQRR